MLNVGVDVPKGTTMEWLEPQDGATVVRFSELDEHQCQYLRDYMLLNRGTSEMLRLRSVARAHLTEFDPSRGHAVVSMYGEPTAGFIYALTSPMEIHPQNIFRN